MVRKDSKITSRYFLPSPKPLQKGEGAEEEVVFESSPSRWPRSLFGPLSGNRKKDRSALRVYDLQSSDGRRRLHLRANDDGSAVLLIDVTDAIHLNPTAALLARCALDGEPADRAASALRRRFRGVDAAGAKADADCLYAMIERLTDLSGRCPTCALSEDQNAPVGWRQPFSAPVSAPYKADLALTYACNNNCRHCYNQRPHAVSATCSHAPHGNTPSERSAFVAGVAESGSNGNPGMRSIPAVRSQAELGNEENNKCFRHGTARPSHSSLPSSLSPDQWLQVLGRLAEIGVPHIIFTGGEPTLFDGLSDLIRRATGLGLVSGLNTNGRRLSDPRFVESLRDAGLDHVQITLQSYERSIHDAMCGAAAFDETLSGLKNSLAAIPHTITNTTLTRHNIEQAGQLVEFLHGLGLTTFAMNGMIFSGGGRTCGDEIGVEELAPVLADVRDRAAERNMRFLWYTPTEYCRLSPVELELGPRRCNAGEYSICVEPNGDVIPCQSYYVPAGNILRDRWPAIWESDLFLRFRGRCDEPSAAGLPERCWDCPDLPLCGGGCPLEREHDRQMNGFRM